MDALRDLGARLSPFGFGLWLWLASGVLIGALAIAYPSAGRDTFSFVLQNLVQMAPLIAASAMIAGAVHACGLDQPIAEAFRRRERTAIVAASLIGALTPICGLGVLPIVAGLLSAGTPLGPIMAFWLSSPITDPAMIAVTAGLLGIQFAVAKTVIAFAIGVGGGYATMALGALGSFRAPLRRNLAELAGGCSAAHARLPAAPRFWRSRERRLVFVAETRRTGFLIGKWLILAFTLESVLRRYLPPEVIGGYLGADSELAIPLAVVIGTPIYVDGYAALPFVRGLLELGMSPGAAMAFLIAGSITSVYASVAILALVRWPVFVWYLTLAVIGSLLAGYGFEAIAEL